MFSIRNYYNGNHIKISHIFRLIDKLDHMFDKFYLNFVLMSIIFDNYKIIWLCFWLKLIVLIKKNDENLNLKLSFIT